VLDAIAIVVYLGAFISMSAFVFEFPVSTLFATSSIVAVILGFALQATVGDVLAGVALTVDRPFREGHWITVDGRHHGRVVDMNWRATRIEQKSGDLLILPNNMLNRATIVNHDIPKHAHRNTVDVILQYNDSTEHVAEVLRAAAMTVPSVLRAPGPKVDVAGFGEGTITYRIKFWVSRVDVRDDVATSVLHAAWKHVSFAGFAWPTNRSVGEAAEQRPARDAAQQLMELLERIPLFATLDAHEREHLASCLQPQIIKQKTRFIRQGENGRSLFIIREGALRVIVTDHDKEQEVARLQPGDYLGEASLLTGAVRNASVEALTDAIVYEIDKDALAPLIAARQTLADDLGGAMAARERARAEARAGTGEHKPAGSLTQIANQIRAFFASA
jgi:CRP-like cAMP-binding protein